MTASPLSKALETLLRSKSIQVKDIKIVVDNAVPPSGDLVDQALEAIILVDFPKGETDLLGISCMCVIPDVFDKDSSIKSDDESTCDDIQLEPVDEETEGFDDREGSRWDEAPGNGIEKTSLVCCPPPHHISPWKTFKKKVKVFENKSSNY
jgi:hypothetical protein